MQAVESLKQSIEAPRIVSTLPDFLHWLPLADQCVAVEGLSFKKHRIDAGQLSQINKLDSLKRLGLWGTEITAGDLRALEDLKNLELLDVHHCENLNQDELVSELDRWPKLRKVVLGNSPAVASNNDEFAHRHFNWDRDSQGVSNDGLEELAKHPLKPIYDLKVRGFTEDSLEHLCQLRRLRSLEIEMGKVPDPQVLNDLCCLPNLKKLAIVGINKIDLPYLEEVNPKLEICFRPQQGSFYSLVDFMNTRGIKPEEIDTLHICGGVVSGFGKRPESNFSVWIQRIFPLEPSLNKHVRRLIVRERYNGSDLKDALNSVKDIENLDELSLIFFQLDDLEPIYQLEGLSHLVIDHWGYHDGKDRLRSIDLGRWPALKSLTLKVDYFEHKINLTGWENLKELRRLNIDGRTKSDLQDDLKLLPNADVFQELVIKRPRNRVTSGLIQQVTRFPNLKTCFVEDAPPGFEEEIQRRFPDVHNFGARVMSYDPAETRYPKAFASLRDEVVESMLRESDDED